MPRTVLLAALLLTLLGAAAPAQEGRRSGRRRRPRPDPATVSLEHFSYREVEFEAPSLESGSSRFAIYLPAGHDDGERSGRRYPWIVWLHGMNGSSDRFHFEGGAEVLDDLRGQGALPELIFVAASAPRRTIYANGEPAGDVQDLILEDLTEYVHEHYRVSTDPVDHAIMGVSVGGLGALRYALAHPDRFGAVATHSAALFPAEPADLDAAQNQMIARTLRRMELEELLGDPIEPEQWKMLMPTAMVADLDPERLHGLRIYFDAGTEDRYGFGPPNQRLHESLERSGIDHSFRLIEGGGHAWGSGSLQQALRISLPFVAEGFHGPEKKTEGT